MALILLKRVLLLTVASALVGCSSQPPTSTESPRARQKPTIESGYEYDARAFLSGNDVVSFNRKYPEFDQAREIDWEYKDVDPIRLFKAAENRKRRREFFLSEFSPTTIGLTNNKPLATQAALRTVLTNEVSADAILMDQTTAKVIVPYTADYESLTETGKRSLLEKTATLGLQWANAGGDALYLYNGPILLSRYRHGYVSFANLQIDNPLTRKKNP